MSLNCYLVTKVVFSFRETTKIKLIKKQKKLKKRKPRQLRDQKNLEKKLHTKEEKLQYFCEALGVIFIF
jgi:hypothetical protein